MGDAASTLNELFALTARPANKILAREPSGRSVTYGELDSESARYAHALFALGAHPGDRVALICTKSLEVLFIYLACVRSGFVLVPMNPSYTPTERTHILNDCSPSVVITDPDCSLEVGDFVHATLAAGNGTVLAELARGQAADLEIHAPKPNDLAAVLYTSGTTGKPKGAMLTQQALATNAADLVATWGFSSEDVLVHALPMFHVHGLFIALNTALGAGCSMLYLPRFSVPEVLEALPEGSVFMGVPTYYRRLLDSPSLDRDSARAVRLFISGSAPLSAAMHTEFSARTGHVILERYGMTELGVIASNPIDGERRAGSVGQPLPSVELRVEAPAKPVDEAPGIGEIEVRAKYFPGYWGIERSATADFGATGYFRTGDLGRIDADGYLSIVGRKSDLVISGGLNVYPSEVETVLDRFDGILESAVIGLPDRDFGESVVAVVVLEPGVVLNEAAIRAAAAEELAPFKIPKRVVAVTELPRNTMGKVEKRRLQERLAGNEQRPAPGTS